MSTPFSILVAEDDESDVLLYQRAFKRDGIVNPIRYVANGQEVFDYLNGVNKFSDRSLYPLPGLILLDIKMPRVGGFDVLRWMGAHHRFSTIPVIMVTSSILPRDYDLAHALGAKAYYAKTVGFIGLGEMIREKSGLWPKAAPMAAEAPALATPFSGYPSASPLHA